MSDGLDKDVYRVVVNVPAGLKIIRSSDKLILQKARFEGLELQMKSEVPSLLMLNEQVKTVIDRTAKSEVFLEIHPEPQRWRFWLYRRLSGGQNPILLSCDGAAENRPLYEALLNACRTAKLK